jgi:hypothetical protein
MGLTAVQTRKEGRWELWKNPRAPVPYRKNSTAALGKTGCMNPDLMGSLNIGN